MVGWLNPLLGRMLIGRVVASLWAALGRVEAGAGGRASKNRPWRRKLWLGEFGCTA